MHWRTQGTDAPSRSNFFHFHAVFGKKNLPNNKLTHRDLDFAPPLLREAATPVTLFIPREVHTCKTSLYANCIKSLFTDVVLTEFEEAFSVFDRDADGVITTSELGVVMTALGHRPSLQELEAIIQGVDTDRKYNPLNVI